MRETKEFAVFPSSAEYHATKETRSTYHSSTHGKVKVVTLNSLCGAYVGSVPYLGGVYPSGEPRTRLYPEAPAGLDFCKACERLTRKRSRLWLMLSQFFRRRQSFQAKAKPTGM